MSSNYELFVDNALQLPEEVLSDDKIRSLAKLQALYPGLEECCLLFQRTGIPFKRGDDKIAVYHSRIALEVDFKSSFSYAFLTRLDAGNVKSIVAEFRSHKGSVYTTHTNKYQEGWKTLADLAEKR